MAVITCPYLGLKDDKTVSRTVPSVAHCCYARQPQVLINTDTQTGLCLSGRYALCPRFLEADGADASPPASSMDVAQDLAATVVSLPPPRWAVSRDTSVVKAVDERVQESLSGWSYSTPALPSMVEATPGAMPLSSSGAEQNTVNLDEREHRRSGFKSPKLWLLLPATAIVGFLALAIALGYEWLQSPATNSAAIPAVALPVSQPTPTTAQNPTVTPLAAAQPPAPDGVGIPPPTLAQTSAYATATPVAGGKVVTLSPAAGVAGWWSSAEQRGHIGDSFLYAGRYAGQDFLSAARFDLRNIPRGAPLEQVVLRMTGLNADRLAQSSKAQAGVEAETTWLVQLIGEANATDLERSDYLTALSAPAAVTLPPLRPQMLAAGQANAFELDDASRAWLAQQLLDGATSIVVRWVTSGGVGDTLFAWDSGQGPESAGSGPALVISYGPPPPTPPPLPTKPFLVATLTPIPANALTVVAQAATATFQATLVGTATQLPYQVYTPTPVPENLETVQAAAAVNGLPAVLLLTPTPASAATATEQAAYATAVALTTGTFTPVPTNFVTPIVVPPSPPAQNVATAAARAVAATAAAQAPASDGLLPTATPTPLPYNAVLGVYVYATPVFIATNAATAVAYNKEMNDAILATGTPTPLPWNAIVITSVPTPVPPSPTPIPLFIPASELTATPTPSPTRITPSELPAEVRGKILFKSDRGGAEAIYMLDPVTGEVTLITQPWVFDLAQQRLPMSSDGAHRALVRQDDDGNLQIFDESLQYGTTRKVTALGGTNYDPAWAPTGDWIAFVSTNTGGDEIYRVDPTGAVAQRLTTNSWEWDKHPTWAPDASQIVFYSNREGGRRQLWIMDADGANQRNLSSNEYNDWDPIWVP